MEISLVRHGQTEWNNLRKIQGQIDIPLNDTGRAQARELAARLDGKKFDYIYTSPLGRAVETAEIASGVSREEFILDPRLMEISFGKDEGKSIELLAAEPDNSLSNPTGYKGDDMGGESVARFIERLGEFLAHIAERHGNEEGQMLIVCHGGSIRSIVANIEGFGPDGFWVRGKQVGNCNVFKILLENGRFSVAEE